MGFGFGDLGNAFHKFKKAAEHVVSDVADEAVKKADAAIDEAQKAAKSVYEAAEDVADKVQHAARELAKTLGLSVDLDAITRQIVAEFVDPLVKSVLRALTSEEDRRKKKKEIRAFLLEYQEFDGARDRDHGSFFFRGSEVSNSSMAGTGRGVTPGWERSEDVYQQNEEKETRKREILCFSFLSGTSKTVLPGPISKGSDGTNAYFSSLLRQKDKKQRVRGIVPMDFVDRGLDAVDLIIKENLRRN